MTNRYLPPRNARRHAISVLQNTYDSDDDILGQIEVDDVAAVQPDEPEINEHVDIDDIDEEELPAQNLVDLDDIDSSSSDEENGDIGRDLNVSPSGLHWEVQAPLTVNTPGREPLRNVFHAANSSSLARGIHPRSNKESFMIIMSDILLSCLVHTNQQGRRVSRDKGFAWKQVTEEELEAFIGLIIIGGAYKAGHRPISEMWDGVHGHNIFRATMSYMRFAQIRKSFRFDDKTRRDKNDVLSPIRNVVNLLNKNLNSLYIPGSLLCIDEQLVEFHGRVSFRQYIPTKPGKFGIKIFWLVDAENSFPLTCLVYIGAQTLSEEERENCHSVSEAVVMKLSTPFLNCGRNITMDNWFTSAQLADKLMQKNTTLVGTIRQNNRAVPPASKSTQDRRKKDSVHYKCNNKMLCSFWDKKQTPVLLLSTMHQNGVHGENRKPDIVEFYNETKAGVDTMDKLSRSYRCQRKTRRWPFSLFMALMDVAIVASYKARLLDGSTMNHYEFKRDLGYELVMPLVIERSRLPNLQSRIKEAMRSIGVIVPLINVNNNNNRQQPLIQRCSVCPRQSDVKTRVKCNKCNIPICKNHSENVCVHCL